MPCIKLVDLSLSRSGLKEIKKRVSQPHRVDVKATGATQPFWGIQCQAVGVALTWYSLLQLPLPPFHSLRYYGPQDARNKVPADFGSAFHHLCFLGLRG